MTEQQPERDPLADEPDVEPTGDDAQEGQETDIPEDGEPEEEHAVEVPF